jgi:phosphoribosylanthranilate isomerase
MSKIKICGLTRMEDIDAVNNALPDYIGFVFAPSRRRVDEKMAALLKERLDGRIKTVGVFVNQEVLFISGLKGIIDIAQLHGDEDGDYIKRVREHYPVIKAVGIEKTLPPLPEEVDYLLFDTLSVQRGGTGKTFDWNVLQDYNGPPYFLAGGLNAESISDAICTLSPFCVDVSSGVETDGVKDTKKIEQFVRLVRCCD